MQDIYGKVARYIGVPEPVVARHDGRVPLGVFVKEARRTDKLLISRYDGSVTMPDPYPDGERARGDVLFDGLRGVLIKGMTGYLADTLGVRADLPYRLLNRDAVRQWNWRSGLGGREGHAGAADGLRDVLASNRAFRVVIAHGMTDLVTPYLTSRYVVDHLPRHSRRSRDGEPLSRRPYDVPSRLACASAPMPRGSVRHHPRCGPIEAACDEIRFGGVAQRGSGFGRWLGEKSHVQVPFSGWAC
jgi:hypothetical protein